MHAGAHLQPRLDTHPGASRGSTVETQRYDAIHDTAARQDGIVKILVGLVCVVLSLGLAMAAILGVHQLVNQHELRVWAFVIGIPGVAMTLFGLALIAWGVVKLGTGKGRG